MAAAEEEEHSGETERASLLDGAAEPSEPVVLEGSLTEEMRKLAPIAGQTTLSMLLGMGMMQQVTVFFVGHIGVIELGAAALGTMWANSKCRSSLCVFSRNLKKL